MFIFKAAQPNNIISGQATLDKLNSFLNAATPELVYWLQNNWQNQQQAITYKELREACEQGFEPQIQKWQEDYAKFINEKLQPIWLSAMKAGAAATSAKHDTFVFDDTAKEVRQWLQKHGAEFVTVISDETRAAIRALVARGQAERWTPDQLARTIRPTIGLNKPQAIANSNYYWHVLEQTVHNNPGLSTKDANAIAMEAARKYAARQQRYRADMIANTELAYAYNMGQHESVRQAMQQGLMGPCVKIWSTSMDHRVCDRCAALSGKKIGFDESFDGGDKAAAGYDIVPPAHPRCRCTVEYEETAPPVFKPKVKPEQQKGWNGKPIPPDPPDPPIAKVPPSLKMPKGMTDKGPISLGGTGEMHLCVDAKGKEWLFKPAVDKGGMTEVAFRAHIQEAASRLQQIVDPDTAVKVGVGKINGKLGAFQERLDVAPFNPMEYAQKNLLVGAIPTPLEIKGLAPSLQREHVTDWLLGNFDSHGRNFVKTKDGKIIGIDKEQSFKYLSDPASHKMSYSYHPNKMYGEKEPVYNTFFRAFADKKIDINPQDSLPFIKRIEAIPDAQYREMFRPYAEALKGKGNAAESLLDQIVERKQMLRETYREFYSDIMTVRNGKKQSFIFADEAGDVLQQPLAAIVHDAATLKKMNKQELLQIAKTKQIAYYNNMNKAQLIEAISDPAKAKTVSKKVKEQLEAAKAARAAAKPAAPLAPKKPSGIVDAGDIFWDLSSIPTDRQGISIRSDGDKIEGMNLTARREVIDGKEYYCIYGKLAEGQHAALFDGMQQWGAKRGVLAFREADSANAIFYKKSNLPIIDQMAVPTHRFSSALGELELVDTANNPYHALDNFFIIRVPNAPGAASGLRALLEDMGADWITETPKPAEETLLKKRRALWVRHPEYSGKEIFTMKEKELDAILAKDKITAKEIQGMRLEDVWKGYSTYIDDTLIQEAKDAGVEYIWSGVTEADSVVAIMKSGGLACTKNRCLMGAPGGGASMESDFESGGADSVFTRIGVKTSNVFKNCFCGRGYRIKIDRSVLGRTDWYAYESDSYGKTEPSYMKSDRVTLKKLAQDMQGKYRNGNEIMFRNGIRSEKFIGINCDTEYLRQELLQKFHAAGIMEINGIPVEDFVTVESVIGK